MQNEIRATRGLSKEAGRSYEDPDIAEFEFILIAGELISVALFGTNMTQATRATASCLGGRWRKQKGLEIHSKVLVARTKV